jgi:hypothetical protein
MIKKRIEYLYKQFEFPIFKKIFKSLSNYICKKYILMNYSINNEYIYSIECNLKNDNCNLTKYFRKDILSSDELELIAIFQSKIYDLIIQYNESNINEIINNKTFLPMVYLNSSIYYESLDIEIFENIL